MSATAPSADPELRGAAIGVEAAADFTTDRETGLEHDLGLADFVAFEKAANALEKLINPFGVAYVFSFTCASSPRYPTPRRRDRRFEIGVCAR